MIVEEPRRIHLVRHGETQHTIGGVFSGAGADPQPRLTERGCQQAAAVGRELAREPQSAEGVLLVTSPLPRAEQTADRIAEHLPTARRRRCFEWQEAHLGSWEGLTAAEVEQREPGALSAVFGDPHRGPDGGESRIDVGARVGSAWDDLAGHPESVVVVVTHLTPIRAVLRRVFGWSWPSLSSVQPPPGSITTLLSWPDGYLSLTGLGVASRV